MPTCGICARGSPAVACATCIKQTVTSKLATLEESQTAIDILKDQISKIIRPSLKFQMDLAMLKDKVCWKQTNVIELDELIEQYQYRIKQVRSRVNKYKKLFANTKFPSPPSADTVIAEIEQLRRQKLKLTAWVLQYNPHFPDFCISELFSLEKCISYSEIVIDEGIMKSIDKPAYIITMRTQLSRSMTDEHRQALLHSINVLCQFLTFASTVLNMNLPCPIERSWNHCTVQDFHGNIHHLDIENLAALETGLLFLYMNFRYLHQQAGVDLQKLRGVFDVENLVSSPFLGKWTTIPSLPVEEAAVSEVDEEEEWEII